eukprot:16150315-Heterocapsa_arctica.AAC.1
MRALVPLRLLKHLPRVGGFPKTSVQMIALVPLIGTKRATPAPRRDATQQLTDNDRVATMAVLESIPH